MSSSRDDLKSDVKSWLDNCDPNTPIPPGDDRYVEFDDHDTGMRGSDHMLPMLDTIEFADEQSCQLFSGFRGTGKTTELKRLAEMLEDEGYAVLYADAVPMLDRIRKSGTLDGVYEDELPWLARYMNRPIVLCYRNGEESFEVQPLIHDRLEERAEALEVRDDEDDDDA